MYLGGCRGGEEHAVGKCLGRGCHKAATAAVAAMATIGAAPPRKVGSITATVHILKRRLIKHDKFTTSSEYIAIVGQMNPLVSV